MSEELSGLLFSIMTSSCAMEEEQSFFDVVLSEIHGHFKSQVTQLFVHSGSENTYDRIACYPVQEPSASVGLSLLQLTPCKVAMDGYSPMLRETSNHTQLLLPLKHETAPDMLLHLQWEAPPPPWITDHDLLSLFGSQLGNYLPWRHMMIKITAAKNHLEAIFDHLPGAVSVINSDYTIERVNKAFSRFFSIPFNEAVGKKCYDVVHGRTSPHEECRVQEALETGEKMSTDTDNGKQLRVTYLPMVMKDSQSKSLQIFQLQNDLEDNRSVEQTFDFLQLYNLLSQPLTVLSLTSGVMSNNSKETISKEYLHVIHKQVEILMAILREAHVAITGSHAQPFVGISP